MADLASHFLPTTNLDHQTTQPSLSYLNLHLYSQDLQYCPQIDNIFTQFSPHLQSKQFFSLCLQQTLSMTYHDLLYNTMQPYCPSIQQLMLQEISSMHDTHSLPCLPPFVYQLILVQEVMCFSCLF